MEDDVVAGGDLTDAATMIAEERSHGVPVLGAALSTRRPGASLTSAVNGSSPSSGTTTDTPSRAAIAISLTATARPPSLQSWAAVTLPSQIAAWIAR